MTHALLSPSACHRWRACPASVVLTKDLPDESSDFAEEGTRAHRLAELKLLGTPQFSGTAVTARRRTDAETEEFKTLWADAPDEMQAAVCVYARTIADLIGEGKPSYFMVEHPVDVSSVTGEAGAHGTVDCVVRVGEHLYVVDLKYGRGVKVEARCNEQLSIYALALCDELDPFGDDPVTTIHIVIVQPRLNHIDHWTTTTGGLRSFAEDVKARGARALALCDGAATESADFGPSESVCRFCRAKGTCPAIRGAVVEAFKAEPAIVDAAPQVVEALSIPVPTETEALSRALSVLDLIDQWTSAVRAEALRQLEVGNHIPGYKLVAGRAGIRRWADAKEAEAKLKSMKVPEALRYEKKLISPTAAAKLTKAKAGEAPVLTERQWAKLEALITRNESKGAVVPESDPRPALDMGEGFKVIEENK